VVANEQTSGKGLDGNSWESEVGKNLTVSIVLKPQFLKPEKQFLLNKAITLGVSDFVKSTLTNDIVRIKWPNDIYVDNGKIAGILINNTISGNDILNSIIGIGININQTLFNSDAPNPISIKQYLKHNLDLNECLNTLIAFLNIRYDQLKKQEYHLLNADYINVLYRYKEVFKYRYNGEIINASITGISDFGKLKFVTSENRILECDMKEIEFLI